MVSVQLLFHLLWIINTPLQSRAWFTYSGGKGEHSFISTGSESLKWTCSLNHRKSGGRIFVLFCFAWFILYALPSRTDSQHKLNGQLFTAEKFRGRKTVVALLLTFPMPELWKNWTDWCHEWCILSKDAITVFHIALPPQEKAKPACTALQRSFPHFPSALFFFFLTSFYARSSQVSFLSHWNKKGSFPFTAKVPWTSHTSLPFAKRKAVLNCRVSSTLQYKFQNCGTATFLSLQESLNAPSMSPQSPLDINKHFKTGLYQVIIEPGLLLSAAHGNRAFPGDNSKIFPSSIYRYEAVILCNIQVVWLFCCVMELSGWLIYSTICTLETDKIKSKAPEKSNQNDLDRGDFQHKYILPFKINNPDQGSKGEIIKPPFGKDKCHMILHRRWCNRGMYLTHYTYCVSCIFQRITKK